MADNKLLYHYTNQTGLLGIIGNKEIWATDSFFVNDSSEIMYAVSLMEKLLLKRKVMLAPKELGLKSGLHVPSINDFEVFVYDQLAEFLNRIRSVLEEVGIFIASFSENGDQLSQWRGYCQNGFGYSLGFDRDSLTEIFNKRDHTLKKCIYDEKEQFQGLNKLIENFQDEFDKEKQSHFELWSEINYNREKKGKFWQKFIQFQGKFALHVLNLAPTYKNPSFEEEEEWRFIVYHSEINSATHKFKEGKSFLIPYLKSALNDDDFGFPLKKIYVGPCPNPELNRLSIRKYLTTMGLDECEVINSSIPFRNW